MLVEIFLRRLWLRPSIVSICVLKQTTVIQKNYLCYQNSCARGRESAKTRTFIIGILFFRLMPHFKMVKNMLRGRKRCTRRTRCSRGRQTSMTRQSSPCRAWGSIMFTLGCAGVQPGSIDINAISNQNFLMNSSNIFRFPREYV